ncbi:MAG TPA: lysophospholipid acyltransferase family protein [Fimbriimonadaceae bacterium]|jgi:KDO2-lipid IV(A) lauroyltransferase
MSTRRKKFERRAGTFAFVRIRKWLLKKDIFKAEKVGERLGRMAFKLGKRRRNITLSNLEIAFPEKTPEERYAIAQGVFEHFGRIMCDFVRSDTRSKQEVMESMTLDGFDHIHDMFPPEDGFIILTGHFGNWERVAQYVALCGYKLGVVVRDPDDGGLNDLVVNLRTAAGLEVIPRGMAARTVLTKLKRHEPVALLPDQNSDESFPLFFGKPTGTVLGPAVLAQRGKSKIYITFCYRTGPGKYRYRLTSVIDPVAEPKPTATEIMARFNQDLEQVVREFPDQYLWMHNRWKSARQKGLL